MDFRPLEWASIGHIVHPRRISLKKMKKTDGTGRFPSLFKMVPFEKEAMSILGERDSSRDPSIGFCQG